MSKNINYNKEREKIKSMSTVKLIKKLLSHYECPGSCKATCCKNLTIPFTDPEVQKILKRSRKSQSVLKNLVYPVGAEETFKTKQYIENYNVKFKVFDEKPCPFLDNDLCSIHKTKPVACAIYPINVLRIKETRELNFKINLCELGFNIYLDYFQFLVQSTVHNPYPSFSQEEIKTISENLQNNEKFLVSYVNADKSNFDNNGFMIIQNIELLKSFIVWLEIMEPAIVQEREKFRARLIEKEKNTQCKQNLECLLPIDIIEVESRQEEYTKKVIIPQCKQFRCCTENNDVVPSWIEAETMTGFIIYVRVPANTSQIYVYPVI